MTTEQETTRMTTATPTVEPVPADLIRFLIVDAEGREYTYDGDCAEAAIAQHGQPYERLEPHPDYLPLPEIATYHRDGIAVNVKDRGRWMRDDSGEIARLVSELGEGIAERCYEDARERFWEDAREISEEAGYGEVYSAGRSGGWLAPSRVPDFLDYVDRLENCPADVIHNRAEVERLEDPDQEGDYEEAHALMQRDDFLRFARRIGALQRYAEEHYVELLQEAHADLEERREAMIVRGYN